MSHTKSIKATCPCGSAFEASDAGGEYRWLVAQVERFRQAHQPCVASRLDSRTAGRTSPQPSPQSGEGGNNLPATVAETGTLAEAEPTTKTT